LPPSFDKELQEEIITISTLNETFIYQFPAIVNSDKQKVKLEINSKLESFMKFDKEKNELILKPTYEGEYQIQTKLTNQDDG